MDTLNEQSELVRYIDQLREQALKIEVENPTLEDFQAFYAHLQRVHRSFQDSLYWALEGERGREKEFRRFYNLVAARNASDLVESLKRTGFRLHKNQAIREAFERQGYRILELVRAGKRDEAFHAILRIFVSINHPFPTPLVEAFKPTYSDELFKVFLFSFLSGVMSKEDTKQEIQ